MGGSTAMAMDGQHLLVVDDEVEVTRALRLLFRRHYVVHEANSAAQAQAILRERTIHVVVCDQRMPEVDGVTFLTTVMGSHPEAIRIILTGYADADAIVRAVNEAKIFRYVTKHWDHRGFASIVRLTFDKYWEQFFKYRFSHHQRQHQWDDMGRVLQHVDRVLRANNELLGIMGKRGLAGGAAGSLGLEEGTYRRLKAEMEQSREGLGSPLEEQRKNTALQGLDEKNSPSIGVLGFGISFTIWSD